VIGADGHGKATLASAIGRLQESRTGARRYSLIPMGPAGWPKGSLTAFVVVVAADDGPLPQTREQIQSASQAGVQPVAVFINKTDAVDDPELVDLIELEQREVLKRYGFRVDELPIVRAALSWRLRTLRVPAPPPCASC
jgi:translation elongation factor EF-Tu-like GTPase